MSAKKRAKPELKEYIFTGTVELHGVTFFIKADSFESAMEMAASGDYDSHDSSCAETVNWTIDPDSGEPNE